MKKLVLTLLISAAFISQNQATTITVTAADFTFSPTSFNCNVGDTVHFSWVNGTHTTTSTTVPAGADSWNAAMQSSSQTFDYVVKVAGTYNYQCNFHVSIGMTGTFTAAAVSGISSVTNENEMIQVSNPASQAVHILLSLAEPKNVTLSLYDLAGKFSSQLLNAQVSAGGQRLVLPLDPNIASGLYILKFQIGDLMLNRKLIIQR